MPERLSGTVTFLFTDIEGSTALLKQLGRTAYGNALGEYQLLLRRAFASHGGDELDTQGDSFCVAFRSAADAVGAAAAVQRSIAVHAWPEGASVRVRVGIHTGEATIANERYLGLAVHRAARVGAAGHGGQVLLSETTRALLTDEELPGFAVRDMGEHRLKDLDRAERLFQLEIEGLPNDFPPLRTPEIVARADAVTTIDFHVLGPLEVLGSDGPLPLGGAKQRALLALLLLNANRVVSRERLIDELWGDGPPETAVTSVQVYVSRLRKLLPVGTLVTRPPGYLLAVGPDALDLQRFERLTTEARSAEPERASRLLREALQCWRGPPLGEFTESFARIEGGRLDDLRLAALEDRIDADLALDRHAALIGELEVLIAKEPHRERLRGQLMLALYRSGRQAEALEAYRDTRATLDELGIEPSERLRQLEKQILKQDAALTLPPPLVIEANALPGPLRATSPYPFVGRTDELAALRSRLALAESGEGGQVALLGGEAGSGKTRLARELAHEAAERGTLVLYGSSQADVNMPYQPFVEALECLVRVSDPVALDAYIGDERPDLARLLPALGEPRPLSNDAQTARHRLHSAVAGLLARAGRQQPLFVVVDDIHWADASSVELLRHLTRSAPEARILVLATYRDRSEEIRPELATALGDLARLEGITRLRIGALTSADVGDFISQSSGSDATPELSQAISTLTDGTPFLLCELWRALTETGTIEIAADGVHLKRPLAELNSPESVRDVVHYRLSRLAPQTKRMLEVAAVAGAEFTLSLLGDEDTLVGAADEAVASGMIEAVADPGAAHRFTHELVRRALYDRLTSVRRAELHLRVGEALERVHAAKLDRFVADLAHHFTVAAPLGGVERAVHYNIRAAEAAAGALAYDAAATNLADALALGIGDAGRRARAQFELGTALLQSGKLKEAEAALAHAMDDALAAGEDGLGARAAVLRNHVRLRTDPPAARAETERVADVALETFTRLGDSGGLAQALRLSSHVHIRRCHWAAAAEALETALLEARHSGDKREIAKVATWLVTPLYYGPTPAPKVIQRYAELLADHGRDPYVEAATSCHMSGVLAMTGRFQESRAAAERGLATLDEFDLTIAGGAFRFYVAEAELLAGEVDRAVRVLQTAYELLERAGDSATALNSCFELAHVLCVQGRYDDAEAWASRGRPMLDTGDVMTRVAGLVVEARLAVHRGSRTKGLRFAGRAVALAAETDALNARAGALVCHAEILGAVGRESDARAAHDQAVDFYKAKGNVVAATHAVAATSSTPRSSLRLNAGGT